MQLQQQKLVLVWDSEDGRKSNDSQYKQGKAQFKKRNKFDNVKFFIWFPFSSTKNKITNNVLLSLGFHSTL